MGAEALSSSGSGVSSSKPLTRVFLADFTIEVGGEFTLPKPESHHIQKVLRGKPGDVFEVVVGGERLFIAELRGGERAVITDEVPVNGRAHFGVVLYQAVPKGQHMDMVVEKATEIGVDRIVPILTERVVVKVSEGKLERWRRLAEAAARQSLQMRVPEVAEPMTFTEALEGASGGVLLHNGGRLPALEEVVGNSAALFIGPEGGWSEGELEMAVEKEVALAGLGSYRLRSETAGLVAVARAQAVLERGLAGTIRGTERDVRSN